MFELVLRLVFSLAVVLGLMLLVARVAQRRLGGRAGAPLAVLHRQAVGRHASVAVVAVGGRTLLLGVTEQQVRMITELDAAELVAVPGAEPDLASAAGPEPTAPRVAPVASLPAARREQDQQDRWDQQDRQDRHDAAEQPFFAAVLREQTAELARTSPAARSTRTPGARRANRSTRADEGPLAGSLLSPTTWRRAVEAVRGQAS
ncbi:FliO/MopB family protein [Nocardioides deserti]|uniref:FliO/MopB family protein n=1 Tax=Nocardioides deserti TaxID=1588644 RepID=A0ABR6UEL2_9ACTN|nr:flagellar biosynthetic protein FliO [Nocardioides deserti]MBC2962409.1 FliO/MopB family protein [Nocardioides deserti]GGO77939.1 hypothetical protein GCM10012276_34210 [Nocardioides deserti]